MERLVAVTVVTLRTTLNDGTVRLLAERTSTFHPRSTDVLDPTDEAGEVEMSLTRQNMRLGSPNCARRMTPFPLRGSLHNAALDGAYDTSWALLLCRPRPTYVAKPEAAVRRLAHRVTRHVDTVPAPVALKNLIVILVFDITTHLALECPAALQRHRLDPLGQLACLHLVKQRLVLYLYELCAFTIDPDPIYFLALFHTRKHESREADRPPVETQQSRHSRPQDAFCLDVFDGACTLDKVGERSCWTLV
mmetsp:Transcript_15788/g.45119  ORF Transcript_15788/g.45119 Transcript_15788/m.45119 type:complete len:249 (-) Transcript_15788:1243-1989(-)